MTFQPFNNPLLLVSDNPALPGGLSRMCRDLATLCCTLPQFRVGVLGRGTGQNSKLPFITYDYPEYGGGWGEGYIQDVWNDFSHGQDGIIMTLDDASRRHWFANPIGLPPDLAKFLGPNRNFQKWMYLPLDSTGPNGATLPLAGIDCVSRYDRVLAASEWGMNVIITGSRRDADWLPHGIWPDKFRVIENPKSALGGGYDILVGCVMANQSRKDWPAAFECFAALRQEYGNRFHAWVHVDELVRYWDLRALAAEFQIGDCLEVTSDLNDDQLALRYSACDCTILPSAGEGFGFPIAEALACGTACIVTDYAGGAELVGELHRVRPVAYRIDTAHNVLRAVLSGYAFAQLAKDQIEKKREDWKYRSAELAKTVEHLQWPRLKHLWSKWMLRGLK